MKNIILVLFCMFLFACNGNSVKSKTDTLAKQAIVKDKAVATKESIDEENPDPDESPEQIMQETLDNYKKVTIVDTNLITTDKDTLHVHLKHYCTYDGAIKLPAGYLDMFDIKTFTTHNFVTDVVLSKHGEITYSGKITRDDFMPLLGQYRKDLMTLLFIDEKVKLSRSGKGVVISYSITIPLTDVGTGGEISIEADGKKRVFLAYGFKAETSYP